jgi:glycosyltransferase involved in cell wall biosynthesis
MKKKRLLHITSSLKMGGAESVLCELIRSQELSEYEHVVVYFHDGVHRAILEREGVAVYHVQGAICLFDPVFFFRFVRSIQNIKPDVIHTMLWAANNLGRIVGKFLAIPVVSVWHNNLDQDGWLRNSIDRITSSFATRHIAVSYGVLESAQIVLGKELGGIQGNVIINGINIRHIHNQSEQRAINGSSIRVYPENFVIGSVGRFELVKRYDLMLEAFALLYAQYAHARLVLVGVGSQITFLRRKAHDLGVQDVVQFCTGVSSYGYYPLFDCFSLSSDKEGVSIALLEAMSFGLPCVITSIENDHCVIEHGRNGLIVEAGNASALARGWAQLIENPGLSIRISESAALTVSCNFSSSRMCREYAHVFKAVDSSRSNLQ